MNNREGLETIWEAPDELWELIGPIILEADPPKVRKSEAASGLTPDRCSTASFSACAAGANGTDCRKNWGTTAQSIAPFNGGWNWVSCAEYGEPWWNSAKSWAAWTGNGRRQTGPWARHVLGGSDWTQPNGSRQGWQQAEPACGRTGRPIVRDCPYGQSPSSKGNPNEMVAS